MTTMNLAVHIHAGLAEHSGNSRVHCVTAPDTSGGTAILKAGGARWKLSRATRPAGSPGMLFHDLAAAVLDGTARATTTHLAFTFDAWSVDNYVLVPGAVYAGNRFPAFQSAYPPLPRPSTPSQPLPHALQISDIPRLNAAPGPSRLGQLTSDPAVPGIGIFFPARRQGLWFMLPERTQHGLLGIELEEDATRGQAVLRFSAPGIRHDHAYEIANAHAPSDEYIPDFTAGTHISFAVCVHAFACQDIQGLFDTLVPLRNLMVSAPRREHSLPFSAARSVVNEKYQRDNWTEPHGYYAVSVEHARSQAVTRNWQMGWVGGMIATHAMLVCGDATAQERALRNFDFVFPHGQAPSGFFYGAGDGTHWYSDHFTRMADVPYHLIRKSADGLFYMLSSLLLLKERGQASRINPAWEHGLRTAADAFVTLWNRYGQFGQFVNHDTGEIVVAHSCSGGLAPAALVLAARYFPGCAPAYLRVAQAAAALFDEQYLRRGITCGGPGDAAQVPDSESCAALLESFVHLHEATADEYWLDCARRCAVQLASWVVSYDYTFPPDSTFGKLGMLTAGTVLANAQNKHSAPGICTHSGLALFRLYRLCGEPFFMDTLRDIAHALPQFLSRQDRPIEWKIPYFAPADPHTRHLPPGWMCERVNLTRWGRHELIGEVFCGSCWCEVSLLLTCAELPGIYAQPDTGRIWSLDHVHAAWADAARTALVLHNPTSFAAQVRVHCETAAAARTAPLVRDYAASLPMIALPPGAQHVYHL